MSKSIIEARKVEKNVKSWNSTFFCIFTVWNVKKHRINLKSTFNVSSYAISPRHFWGPIKISDAPENGM